MLTIEEFCDKHEACSVGKIRATNNCADMLDAWQKLPCVYLIWVATRKGVLTRDELVRFASSCAAARYAASYASDAARYASDALYADAAASYAAAAEVAASYASDAAAASYAANYAASYASDAAANAAASAEKQRQCDWLRANTKPNFS